MTGSRVALIIATYRYDDPTLRELVAPPADAEALANVLKDPEIAGFEVTTLINETRDSIGEAIGDFYDSCQRDDLSLLYFSGHGLKDDEGRLFLAAKNTRRQRLGFTALGAEQLSNAMEACPSRQKVLVLDCCYSGAFPLGRMSKADSAVHTLERFQGKGRAVLTASDSTQYSFEGDKRSGQATQSVFTRVLVEALSTGAADLDGDGNISIDELYRYVHERVIREMPQQRPKKQENVEGNIILAWNRNWEMPQRVGLLVDSPYPKQRLAALDELEYLYSVGSDLVRMRVRQQIELLVDDDSRSIAAAAQDLIQRLGPAGVVALRSAEHRAAIERNAEQRAVEQRAVEQRVAEQRVAAHQRRAARRAAGASSSFNSGPTPDAILEPFGSQEASGYAKTPRKAAASGWIGTAFVYYDFFIYAQAAALVFPTTFFPSGNPNVATIASFAIFGVGFLARPIGAIVLGHWGDTRGRKNMLVLCMLLMGSSTFMVALLPTYESVGIVAPVLLVVLRLVQGFAVGGAVSGASAMIVEHAPFGWRGYFGSFTVQGVQAGQILAAAVFLPLSAVLSVAAFQSWGWRIPFLLSIFVIVAGYMIRRGVDETPAFMEEAERGEVPRAPIATAVKESGVDMLRVACLALMNAIPTAATVFGATFATAAGYGVGLTATNYLWISLVGNFTAVVLIPFVGNLADHIGRRLMMIIGCLGSGILAFPYLYFVSESNLPLAFLFAILMWGVVYQGYNAVFPTFHNELFPTRTRVTASAVSLNVGLLITATLPAVYSAFAGPAPSACVVDRKFAPDVRLADGSTCRDVADAIQGDVVWSVGAVTFGLAIVAAVAAFSARETFRVRLDDLGMKNATPVAAEEYHRIRRRATYPV